MLRITGRFKTLIIASTKRCCAWVIEELVESDRIRSWTRSRVSLTSPGFVLYYIRNNGCITIFEKRERIKRTDDEEFVLYQIWGPNNLKKSYNACLCGRLDSYFQKRDQYLGHR